MAVPDGVAPTDSVDDGDGVCDRVRLLVPKLPDTDDDAVSVFVPVCVPVPVGDPVLVPVPVCVPVDVPVPAAGEGGRGPSALCAVCAPPHALCVYRHPSPVGVPVVVLVDVPVPVDVPVGVLVLVALAVAAAVLLELAVTAALPDADAPAVSDRVDVPVAAAVGDGVDASDGVCVGVTDGDGDTLALRDALGDALALGEPLALADGDRDALGDTEPLRVVLTVPLAEDVADQPHKPGTPGAADGSAYLSAAPPEEPT